MIQHTQLENNMYSLDTMCSKSDWLELLSLLVHVTVVPLREAVARKLREETKQFC